MSFMLTREKTKTTPYILIDEKNGYMHFEGESYLEDIVGFFKEINEWLENFLPTDFTEFTFDCALEYFNSSTTKQLYNILRLMDKNTPGKKVTVNWIVAHEDDDMLIECGEDYQDEMENLEFNIIIKEETE